MKGKLYNITEASALIEQGRLLVIAGDDSLLRRLPQGNWIGGSNPYLLDADGGKHSRELLYVKDFTGLAEDYSFKLYDAETIEQVATDAYDNGLILLVLPFFTDVHFQFALKAPALPNQYINPLMGWVAGVDFDKVGIDKPAVYARGQRYEDKGVALHIQLPPHKVGRVEIVNVYEQGDGDVITFEEDGFFHTHCLVNGERRDLYEYMLAQNSFLPLVADYTGAKINVGMIKDDANRRMIFAAPTFRGVEYRLAKPVEGDYQSRFFEELRKEEGKEIEYSYSCLYNYFNFQLEGKALPGFTGVFTYGEIGYHLLNVTFVYLVIEDML